MTTAYLGVRLWRAGEVHGRLLEACERRKPVLLDVRGGLAGDKRIDALVGKVNELLEENIRVSATGQGYLGQIQTTLGNLREAVVMVDEDQIIRLANPAFRELVGMVPMAVGRRLDGLVQGTSFQEFLLQTRKGGEAHRREMEVQIAEDRRWLEISTAPMPDEGLTEGRFTLYVFHDITRQKGLEKMRTEFVANASHDLRTPVTIIKGYADTLLEDDKDLSVEERRRFLEKISTHSERLNLLLRDLLFLSRLESTGSALHRERWSVSRLIEDTAESWRGVLEDGQQLHYAFAAEEDIVFADSLRFSQVVMNLLENIRRHAKGFTRIDISTTVERDGVWVAVADDGQGIPEKDLPHIFQRFYRVEKGRSRESGGTGLGLAIVKHIVQEHGGEVSARSQRGQGTRIDIFLPFPGQMAQQTMFRSMRGEKPQASASTATADRASPPGAATAVKEE